MQNIQQTIFYILFSLECVAITILILSPFALATVQNTDVYELWNTIEEFEEVSSLRNLLLDKDWISNTVSMDRLDYILVLVQQCSNEFFPKVQTPLVLAIISVESNFREDLLGFNDDTGLMQVIPKYHKERIKRYLYDEKVDLYDPRLNIMVAMDYLEELLEEFDGDEYAVISAYNMGPDAAKKLLSNGYSSSYTDEVIKRMNEFKIFFERRNVSCS